MLKHLLIAALSVPATNAAAADLRQCGAQLLSETGHEDRAPTMLLVTSALSKKRPQLVAAVLILGLIETGLNPHAPRGRAGELGTFQVLPSNVAWLSAKCGVNGDPENVIVSARLAACYLDALVRDADGDWDAAVAAYNAGPRAMTLVRNYQQLPKVTAQYLWRFMRLKERNSCSNQSSF